MTQKPSIPDSPPFQATMLVSGHVQGVGYRNFVAAEANRVGLGGHAKNLRDGRVEVRLEGPRAAIELVIDRLRIGPPSARVEAVDVRWQSGPTAVKGFRLT